MSLLSLLSPTSWIGKIGIWAALFFAGMYYGTTLVDPCPPTTQNNTTTNLKVKAKKNSNVDANLISVTDNLGDCEKWLLTLSMKEIRAIKK